VESVRDVTRLCLNPQIGEALQFRNGYVFMHSVIIF